MSYTVSKEKVQSVLDFAEEHLDFSLIYKQEGYPKRVWFLPAFAWLVTLIQNTYRKVVSLFSKKEFGKTFRDRLDQDFSQGLFGLVLLNDRAPLTEFRQWVVLRHEVQHLVDQQLKTLPGMWYLSYLFFPLPVFLSGRANEELRGYTQNMLCIYHVLGEVPGGTREWIAEQLTSWTYFKPFFSKTLARRVVDHVADRIEDEKWELTFDLDINFWKILWKVL